MPKLNKKYLYSFIVIGIASMMGLLVPFFFKEAVDAVDSLQRTSFLLKIFGLYLVQYVVSIIGSVFVLRIGENYIQNLRNLITSSVISAKIENFNETNSGEFISMISNHVTIIKDFIVATLPNFVGSVMTILGALGVLFFLDYQLALVVFVVLPLMGLCVQPLANVSHKYTERYLNRQIIFSAKLSDVLGELAHIKVNNMENSMLDEFSVEVAELKKNSFKNGIVNILTMPLALMIIFMSISFVFYFGGSRVADGTLTIGTLVAFLIYMLNLLNPFSAVGSFFAEFGKYKASSQRIKEILQLKPEESEGTQLDAFQMIKLESVTFQYANRDKQVLKGVDMLIPNGKRIAMVGPSGSGKTTIINLLTKLYNDYGGQILVNEIPFSELDRVDYRDHIAYVSQSGGVLSGTLRDNLLFGVKHKVDDTTLLALADQFDLTLMGDNSASLLDTEIGEKGKLLSGGQKQKVQLIRAVLKDASLIILDEATSNLDAESEGNIIQYLKEHFADRLILVVAHRLSTIVDSDYIYFIEDGAVTGEGTQHDLMETHARYQSFIQHQILK